MFNENNEKENNNEISKNTQNKLIAPFLIIICIVLFFIINYVSKMNDPVELVKNSTFSIMPHSFYFLLYEMILSTIFFWSRKLMP